MRNPNGYGSVVNLGKNRRKPYAVRISKEPKTLTDGRTIPQYKYLNYFEKRTDAIIYLAQFNSGVIPIDDKKMSISTVQTFKQVYEEFIVYSKSRKRVLGESSYQGYNSGFKRLSELHYVKFPNITYEMLQKEIDKSSNMSAGTMNSIRIILSRMYKYAIKKSIVSNDISALCDYDVENRKASTKHIPFTHDELEVLWKNSADYDTGTILIMIYTGMRITEAITLLNSDINLEERYFIHGEKTDAGKDRVIPIHEKIYPIIKNRIKNGEYLIDYECKRRTRQSFYYNVLEPLMNKYGMKHFAHDTRHTAATLMKKYKVDDYYRKLILGHKIKDITDGIYTHTEPKKLVEEINKILV